MNIDLQMRQHIKRCPMCGGKAGIYQDYHDFYLKSEGLQ